jgi:hypothetical protein
MKQVNYKVNIDTSQSTQNVDKLNKDLETTNKEILDIEDNFQKVNKDSKKVNKGVQDIGKSAQGAKKGFKAMGLALKAVGIGLLISALSIVKDLFMSSQKAVDTFNTATQALSIAFNDLVNVFTAGSDSMFSSWENFTNALNSGYNFVKRQIIDQFKGQWMIFTNSFELGVLNMRIAWNEFTGDTEETEELKKRFVKAAIGIKEGMDLISGSFVEIGKVALDAGESVIEYAKETYKAAEANVELAKQADIATVKQQGLIEKYDRQAELLRQIRDNELKSIDERIQANNELKEVLDEQEKAMLALVNLQIKQAQTQYNLNKNIENEKALIEAKNEKLAVLAQIEGFRSEQDVNANALIKEKIELEQTVIDGINERTLAEKQAVADLQTDEIKKLQIQRDALEQEKLIENERLENKRNLYAQGTQAWVDANEELLNFQADAAIREKQINADLNKAILENDRKLQDQKLTLANDALGAINALVQAFAKEDEESAKRAFNINKAIGIAQAIVSTAQGVINAYANPVDVASGVAFAKSAIIAATGAAQIAVIAKTKFESPNVPSESTPSAPTGVTGAEPQPPAFNVVGQSGFNQIATALGQDQPPIQAFVVSQDVTTAQQLDNAIIETATF